MVSKLCASLQAETRRHATPRIAAAISHPGFRMSSRWGIAKALRQRSIPFLPQTIGQHLPHACGCDLALSAAIQPDVRTRPLRLPGIMGTNTVSIEANVTPPRVSHSEVIEDKPGHGRDMPPIGRDAMIGQGAIVVGPVIVNPQVALPRNFGTGAQRPRQG